MKIMQKYGLWRAPGRIAFASALAVVSVLTTRAVADGGGGAPGMVGGDTGTLPITTPTDPLAPGLTDQAFYLRGDRHVLSSALHQIVGAGDLRIMPLEGNDIWVEFYGDVELVLREDVLRTARIEMGVVPGVQGGGMRAALEIDGALAPVSWVPTWSRVWLPYDRIESAGLLQGSLALRTLQDSGERGRVDFTHGAGFLTIVQDL